jgi:hypothetical protein
MALALGPLVGGAVVEGISWQWMPIAGVLAERYGSRAFMAAGLALQATALGWLATIATASTTFGDLVVPFAMAGVGCRSCSPRRRARCSAS